MQQTPEKYSDIIFCVTVWVLLPNPLAQVPDLIPPRLSQSLDERQVPLLPVRAWQGSFLKETIVKRDRTTQ